jgi:hypothetical protein
MAPPRGSKYFKFLKIFIISKNLKYLRSFRKNRSSAPFPQVKIFRFDTPRKWQSFWGASARTKKKPEKIAYT